MSFYCFKKGNTYTATIIYNLLDYYDWQPNSPLRGGLVTDGEMYDLHRAGWVREYKSVGTYTKEITWNKGDRLSEEFIL